MRILISIPKVQFRAGPVFLHPTEHNDFNSKGPIQSSPPTNSILNPPNFNSKGPIQSLDGESNFRFDLNFNSKGPIQSLVRYPKAEGEYQFQFQRSNSESHWGSGWGYP